MKTNLALIVMISASFVCAMERDKQIFAIKQSAHIELTAEHVQKLEQARNSVPDFAKNDEYERHRQPLDYSFQQYVKNKLEHTQQLFTALLGASEYIIHNTDTLDSSSSSSTVFALSGPLGFLTEDKIKEVKSELEEYKQLDCYKTLVDIYKNLKLINTNNKVFYAKNSAHIGSKLFSIEFAHAVAKHNIAQMKLALEGERIRARLLEKNQEIADKLFREKVAGIVSNIDFNIYPYSNKVQTSTTTTCDSKRVVMKGGELLPGLREQIARKFGIRPEHVEFEK